jgi:hypothetical protein
LPDPTLSVRSGNGFRVQVKPGGVDTACAAALVFAHTSRSDKNP